MVCIAAFIILCLLSVFVAVLSIFRRDLGKKYWKTFKKAWGCVGKKVTLQKCETGFKDDIKNSILKKVIIKKPKLVKPISVGIEVGAVLIVAITVWSLVVGIKSGLSLWALGTCDITRPSACTLGAEVCSIDGDEPKNVIEGIGRWFTDWGVIFAAIPDKFRSWEVSEFDFAGVPTSGERAADAPLAVDIMDPGCVICLQSYRNQLEDGFFNRFNVTLVPFAIQNPDGGYKFRNSGLVVRYVLAVNEFGLPRSISEAEGQIFMGQAIFSKIFTEFDENNMIYQTVLNDYLDEEGAELLLKKWLLEWGYAGDELELIAELAHGDGVTEMMARNKDIVENKINAKGIPTMIFDGRRHTGRYEVQR
jgi:hypothetical protein